MWSAVSAGSGSSDANIIMLAIAAAAGGAILLLIVILVARFSKRHRKTSSDFRKARIVQVTPSPTPDVDDGHGRRRSRRLSIFKAWHA